MRRRADCLHFCVRCTGVATGDRVLLPEYGGQNVKLNDTECAPKHTTPHARPRAREAGTFFSLPCLMRLRSLSLSFARFRRFVLYRDEEILGVLKDE